MNVLIISGSPRVGGNSDILCDQFAKGAAEAGHTPEKISLARVSIAPCKACYACHKDHTCIIKDDMAAILEKMIQADVIVLATPIYFYSLDAQLKLLIDRCFSRYLEIQNKKFYYIVTAADAGNEAADAAIASLQGFIRCLNGSTECGTIYGMGAWGKGDILSSPAMAEAYEAGKAIK